MTATLDQVLDLSAYEFSIPCEFPSCGQPAVAMVKGCEDPAHVATCGKCLAKLEHDFEACKPAVCSICYRPFLHFETHYSTEAI